MLMSTAAQIEVLALTGLAAACGAAIGLERERSGKAAGLRTHILIAASSAMATGAGAAVVGSGDPTRVFHGVITGIGFLGSGVIFRDTQQPAGTGHTSAAAIMLTAMIGAVCGLGAPVLAVGGTAFAFATLWYARRVERRLNNHWGNRDLRRRRRERRRTGIAFRDLLESPAIDLRDQPRTLENETPNPRPKPRNVDARAASNS